jgi:hypothetical protein
MKRTREEVLADVAEKERIIKAVVAGEDVACKVCGLPLKYFAPGSGRHPGIYCETSCTEILMTFGPKPR